MDKIRNMHNVALGIIIGLFLGGIFQARPKFEWNLGVKQPVSPQWNINKIKSAIIKEKSIKDYELGSLTDIVHPGEVGWVEINQKIIEYFMPKEIKQDNKEEGQ